MAALKRILCECPNCGFIPMELEPDNPDLKEYSALRWHCPLCKYSELYFEPSYNKE
jgi:rubredoxin